MRSQSKIRVRYAETDQMGIVHHSNYAVWFEVGRTDFFINAGVSDAKIEEQGIMFPLYEMNCKFKSPARYADELVIKTKLKTLTAARLCFEYEVYSCESNRLLATGETMHAWAGRDLSPINAIKKAPEIYSVLSGLIEK